MVITTAPVDLGLPVLCTWCIHGRTMGRDDESKWVDEPCIDYSLVSFLLKSHSSCISFPLSCYHSPGFQGHLKRFMQYIRSSSISDDMSKRYRSLVYPHAVDHHLYINVRGFHLCW